LLSAPFRLSSLAHELHSFFASLVIKTTDNQNDESSAQQLAIVAGPVFFSPFLEEDL
jgi:hypothetical protein